MSATKSLTIAVRFPTYASKSWRARCIEALQAGGGVDIVPLTPATPLHALDLILDFTARPVDPVQLAAPRLGYWTFACGANPERIEPGLMEFLAGRRAAYVRLVQLTQPYGARVLKEGAVKTVAHSLGATRERLLEAVVDWPARQLQECLLRAGATQGPETTLRERGKVALLCLHVAIPFAWVRNVMRRIVQAATRERWAIGVISQPIQTVLESFDPAAICWLPAPTDGFLADPFGRILPDGRLSIMAEVLSWRDARGRIVAFERESDGTLTPARKVFPFTGHASYPQLIEHAGEVFCLPEICQQRRVQLFRADPFPNRWIPDQVLLEGFAGVDPTLCRHDGRWWLFVGNHEDQDEAKLFIFHAADLRGPWIPHAANPVKCDLRSARPAGTPFHVNGDLYRPAQDCSLTYGGALVINKITQLSPTEFSEQRVAHLGPAPHGPYPDGLHTLSGAGDMTLVDGKRHEISPASVAMALRQMGHGLSHRLFGTRPED